MRRRALLRTGALAATTISLAGCSRQEGSPDGSRLGEVSILNRDDAPRTVEFRVEWAGEVVHESTHELSPDGSASPARTWPEEPGRFTVSARHADGTWRSTDPSADDYPDCFAVVVMIRNGRVKLWDTQNRAECAGLDTESA